MGSDTNAPYIAETNDPAQLIAELCALFYNQGLMAGTAGGMSIRDNQKIYITPSGVQKERMRAEDITVFDEHSGELIPKDNRVYKASASAPLFKAIHRHANAGSCIHTHSSNSVMATLLFKDTFRISRIENIKAIPKRTEPGNLSFFDTLEIPIIENKAHEEELEDDIVQALKQYPGTPAVLVRRHGVYTWGDNVWKAKVIQETLEYLFDLAIKMKQFGIESEV